MSELEEQHHRRRRRSRCRRRVREEEGGSDIGRIDWPRFILLIANGLVLLAFLLLIMLAPLPIGANREWAWAPILVALGNPSADTGTQYANQRTADGRQCRNRSWTPGSTEQLHRCIPPGERASTAPYLGWGG